MHKCMVCGGRLLRDRDRYGNWDGETYYCPRCASEDDDDEDIIGVYDAALIWESHGCDEDYMFGYTEEELEDALS